MKSNCEGLWGKCLAVIKDIVPEAAFSTWFLPIVPVSYENMKFTIEVPSQFFYEYLEEKYISVLKVTLSRVFGEGTNLSYRVVVDRSSGGTVDYPAEETSLALPKKTSPNGMTIRNPFDSVAVRDLDPNLNPQYNFNNFIEGVSNRLARTAGETVAQSPGKTAFNPLFIYGPSGVGKTHLCHAIGIRIRELYPEKSVLYVSSHLFKVQFTDAVRRHSANDFLNFYQGIDVLILDDIQELIGMTGTLNTFFHVFNHLHNLNKQLILTSDQPPVNMQGMEERLITRLKWGLTAELQRPDAELRRKILRGKIEHEGIVIPEEVFDYIAENVTGNIRDLEGILVSLMANSVINNKEIDLSLAKRVVSQAIRVEKKVLSIQDIQKVVCDYYDVDETIMLTKSRKREIVQARQVTMFLAKKYTNNSFSRIGTIVGRKNHATVLHACKTVQDQIEVSDSFRSDIKEIEDKLS